MTDYELQKEELNTQLIAVRRLLKKYGYPPDIQKLTVENIVEQAELMASNI